MPAATTTLEERVEAEKKCGKWAVGIRTTNSEYLITKEEEGFRMLKVTALKGTLVPRQIHHGTSFTFETDLDTRKLILVLHDREGNLVWQTSGLTAVIGLVITLGNSH